MKSERLELWSIERGRLVRSVVPRRGKPYAHRCSIEVFTEVAHLVEEAGDDGVILEELAIKTGEPSTQIAVALAFLYERSIVERVLRRNVGAKRDVYLDAMTEWHALANACAAA